MELEWNRVEDFLPESMARLIVTAYEMYGGYDEPIPTVICDVVYVSEIRTWFRVDYSNGPDRETYNPIGYGTLITHWMYVPEPAV